MRFITMILRIKSLVTAFAFGVLVVAMFSGAMFSPAPNISPAPETTVHAPKKPNGLVAADDYAVFSAVMEQRLSFRATYVVGAA